MFLHFLKVPLAGVCTSLSAHQLFFSRSSGGTSEYSQKVDLVASEGMLRFSRGQLQEMEVVTHQTWVLGRDEEPWGGPL